MSEAFVAPGAEVAPSAVLGEGTKVWSGAVIGERAAIGRDCTIGRGAYLDAGVVLGDRCKVQNQALVYHPARLGNGVFVGPAVVLTNDRYPRAVDPDGTKKTASDWDAEGVEVGDGASLGARSVIAPGLRIGAWAMVAAGAVVTRDVPPHALVVGVPARQVGWVGRAGRTLLPSGDQRWTCPGTGVTYVETPAGLEEST